MVNATGDLPGNVEKLKLELGKIKFPAKRFNEKLIREGDPAGLLPILHYSLLNFSKPLAQKVVQEGYELNGKTDLRFLEAVWKLLRIMLGYRPSLTVSQFLSQGFAERKVLMMCDVIAMCKHEHNELLRAAGRPAAARRRPRSCMGTPSAHIWGSPVKKSVGEVSQSSPPPSALRRRKKQMQQTPPHLQAPRGHVEVVDGGDIPVHVVRSGAVSNKASTSAFQEDVEWDVVIPGHPYGYLTSASEQEAAPASAQEDGAAGATHVAEEEAEAPRSSMPLFEGTFAGWAKTAGLRASQQLQTTDSEIQPPSVATEAAIQTTSTNYDETSIVVVVNKDGNVSPKRCMKMRSPLRSQASPSADAAGEMEGHVKAHRRLQALVEDLAGRLERAETRIGDMAVASQRTEQTLQARITILDGRVRFLEGALEERGSPHWQQQQHKHLSAAHHHQDQPATGRSSPLRQWERADPAASSPVATERIPPTSALGRALEIAAPYRGHTSKDSNVILNRGASRKLPPQTTHTFTCCHNTLSLFLHAACAFRLCLRS